MEDGFLLAEENRFLFREMSSLLSLPWSSHNPTNPTSNNSAPSELFEDIAFELYVTKIVPNLIPAFQSNPSLGGYYKEHDAEIVDNIVIDEEEEKTIVVYGIKASRPQDTPGSSRRLPHMVTGREVSFETPYSISKIIIDQIIDGMFKYVLPTVFDSRLWE